MPKGGKPHDNPGGGNAAGELARWQAFFLNIKRFHAVTELEKAYQTYSRDPSTAHTFGALRALVRWGRLNKIGAEHLAIMAELARVDDGADSPFQLVLKRRKPTASQREKTKLMNAKRKRSLTQGREENLFFRALLHREATGDSLTKAFEAVASGTDQGAYPRRRVQSSFGTVQAAYNKWIRRFRAAGLSEIKYGPEEAIQTITLRGKGRPKKP